MPLRAPETKDAGAFESPRATEGARAAEGTRAAEGARATEDAWSIMVRERPCHPGRRRTLNGTFRPLQS